MSSSVKPLQAPGMISSSWVPGCAADSAPASAAARPARRARRHRVARRRRCGCAPATSRSPSRRRSSASCSSAVHLLRSARRSPCPRPRLRPSPRSGSHEWPSEEAGVDRGADPRRRCRLVAERRPVPGEARPQRGERDALDTRHQPGQVVDVLARPAGASVKPQLPPNTVVTPCSGDGLAVGSQNSCAS